MEEKDVNDHGGKSSESDTVSHGEESAKVQRAFFLIRIVIEVKILVDDGCNVVFLSAGGEEAIGKEREVFRIVDVEPVRKGSDDVHNHEETGGDIGGGEPWAG